MDSVTLYKIVFTGIAKLFRKIKLMEFLLWKRKHVEENLNQLLFANNPYYLSFYVYFEFSNLNICVSLKRFIKINFLQNCRL